MLRHCALSLSLLAKNCEAFCYFIDSRSHRKSTRCVLLTKRFSFFQKAPQIKKDLQRTIRAEQTKGTRNEPMPVTHIRGAEAHIPSCVLDDIDCKQLQKKFRRNFTMARNKVVVPEAQSAMDKFKMEAASEVGVNLKQGYNGDLTSRQAGSVGGQMVKKMIEKYENDIKNNG